MPAEGVELSPSRELLTSGEILRLVSRTDRDEPLLTVWCWCCVATPFKV